MNARAAMLACCLAFGAAGAQTQNTNDRNAERAARRLQQQMQGLQQQLQQAQSDKGKTEGERAELEKQLKTREQAATRLGAAQRAAEEKLRVADAERSALAARVAELERALETQRDGATRELATKDRELAQAAAALKARDTAQGALQARFVDQVRLVTECTSRNGRLVALSAELIERYRTKGVAESLRQREPVLGLRDVEIYNLVQDWRDRADAERFVPVADPRSTSP